MTHTNDGGPAFPREDYQASDAPGQRGMSLRDYFAAKAMQAELETAGANEEAACALADAAETAGQTIMERVAWLSYRIADAMLAERTK